MGVHIDIADAVDVAKKLGIDVSKPVADIEVAMAVIGQAIATKLGIYMTNAEVQESGFGGACVSFINCEGNEGRALPAVLEGMDIGGELG